MRRRILILTLLLFPVLLCAQPARVAVPDLDFASLDSNRIVFKGDSSAFERFFEKLDSVCFLEKGNVNILHAGGSHVQGGTMTREFRNDMLSLGSLSGTGEDLDAGRGLIFPFSAARTNNPSSFKTRREGEWMSSKSIQKEPAARLGLTGMAITTSDPSAYVRVVMTPRNPMPSDRNFSFEKVSVLGYPTCGDLEPVLVSDQGDTLTASQQDSCWSFLLPAPMDSVTVALRGRGGSFTITGILLKNERPGITVTGTGVNGATLTAYSRCQDLERDLAMVKPDLVIFAIGINDAIPKDFSEEAFKTRYRALIERMRSVNPECALLFVTNNDSFRHSRRSGYYVNSNGPRAEHAFLSLAEEVGAGVWDQFEIMGGLGSMKQWEGAGLARRDKIHFTDEGYVILGDLLYNALMEKYTEHLNRRTSNE